MEENIINAKCIIDHKVLRGIIDLGDIVKIKYNSKIPILYKIETKSGIVLNQQELFSLVGFMSLSDIFQKED